jgi:dihydroxyacetone kinase-like protein
MDHLSLIRAATETLVAHVDELTELDSAIGDGDHGLNMKRGALAIQAKLSDWRDASLNEALKAAGTTCIATIGGSSGPVFGTLLVTLAKELPAEPGPADLGAAIAAAIAALTRLGKAEVGQKTLLDVLDPVQRLPRDRRRRRRRQGRAFASARSTAPRRPRPRTRPAAGRRSSAIVPWATSIPGRARPP